MRKTAPVRAILRAKCDGERCFVAFDDGVSLELPLGAISRLLAFWQKFSLPKKREITISPHGAALLWPRLDLGVSVAELSALRPSESVRWDFSDAKNSPGNHEFFLQNAGRGALELRGGALEVGIWVNGKPLVFDAYDCSGSIGRFTILFDGAPRPNWDAHIARAAAQGFVQPQTLAESVRPLLDLMPNGAHELWLQEITYGAGDWQCVDFETRSNFAAGKKAWIYPDSEVLAFTQPYDFLNDETVLNYAEAIQNGARPSAIVWQALGQITGFVLDGHHKIAAYWLLQKSPRALFIRSQISDSVPLATAQKLVEPFGEIHYLSAKQSDG